MTEYEAHAQLSPWFYQAEAIGGKEFETRLVLRGLPVPGPYDVPEAKIECVAFQIAKLRSTTTSLPPLPEH